MTAPTHPWHRARPFREAARHYRARPPYSAELRDNLARKLGWDGTGRLLDLGCGPGILALELAPCFHDVVGLDAEEAMLDEACRAGAADGRIRWVHARAEDLPELHLGFFDAAILGQSLHWMDKDLVLQHLVSCLVPGGSVLLVHHVTPQYEVAPAPEDSGIPAIPYGEIDALLVRMLGHGKPAPPAGVSPEPYSELLARHVGPVERLMLPGRTDLYRSVDDVIGNYLSTSFASPDLFGDRLAEFRREMEELLLRHSPSGRFHEWPGETEVLIATKHDGYISS